ncbi:MULTISPECIES: hypothetical protein [Bradyrhizobium]|uniref:hypothetical protein n=1 Tax=Bradyrhizobium TaxID=374 RepID=UPI00155E1B97|nr:MULTISPECIES: hypothetical protein [Bradyrhizobium]MBR1171507.1 hypothetical protein [Bradyrhizobium liaoningense]MDD1519943.1 hypothetical protein [Bradyrhizobium sp. WBAH30]MDD1544187.1 hypothetical protein [Bradyrhizobium sp. WBAH41]MDD1560821.1 hypothetical protein [Bradyrhizobium sp. WBAH23]MDD1566588.1 hypothetical protein [Bradyrhizobium sp. WBAH33]
MEPANRISDHIDRKTARSICDEVGDRLQQHLLHEASPLPSYLERLVDELRERERHQIDGVGAPADRFLHAARR